MPKSYSATEGRQDPENARREFRIIWSLNVGSRDIIDRFKDEIASRNMLRMDST
jgi:hypothetical protein